MRRTPPQLQPAMMAIVWVERPAEGACSGEGVTNRVKRGARRELRGWCVEGKSNAWGKEQWQQDKELEPMLLQKQQHKQQQQCR